MIRTALVILTTSLWSGCSELTEKELKFSCEEIDGELKMKRCINHEVVCYQSLSLKGGTSCLPRKTIARWR